MSSPWRRESYPVGGILLRKGDRKWVNALYVTSLVHTCLLSLFFVGNLYAVVRGENNVIGLLVSLLATAAVGQLAMKLQQVRKEM